MRRSPDRRTELETALPPVCYAEASVPFYWICDPARRILTVYRLDGDGFAVALQAKTGEIVAAPPFETMPLRIGILFGEDPD